jgi:hypothetical protein
MPSQQHEIWLVLVSLSAGDRYRDKAATPPATGNAFWMAR